MNKSIKYILLAVGFVVLLFGAVKGYDYLSESYTSETTVQQTTQSTGNDTEEHKQKAPDFTVYDEKGNSVSLSGMQGKPTIVNFWATWCVYCVQEMPDFQKAYDEYGDKVNFMMINLTDGDSETKDMVEEFLGKTGYTFPVYYDTELDATYTYGAYSIPRTFIIDAEGNIVYGVSGPVSEDTLVKHIKALIGE
ncbi:MAG: TlpA family protein disulfide reductase [Clostridia bacterium]|nr:TlpA family protein disulfide reductase [Clostridia bacterium]